MSKEKRNINKYKKRKILNPIKSISGILQISSDNSGLVEEDQGYAFIKKHF